MVINRNYMPIIVEVVEILSNIVECSEQIGTAAEQESEPRVRARTRARKC